MLGKTRLRVLLILILLLPILTIWTQAQANLSGTTISILNVRANPDGSVISQIGVNVAVQVEGRNQFGNWVLMHSADNAIRGWVATRFIRWQDDVAIETIPVTIEVIGGVPAPTNTTTVEVNLVPAATSGEFTGTTISTLNVRSGDGTSNPAIGQIAVNVSIIIEGRNQAGDWFLMHATDGSIRGWIASRYVKRQSDIAITDIPVVGAVIARKSVV